MFSRIIDIHPHDPKQKKPAKKAPKAFGKRPPEKKRLSKKLADSSLLALKEMLTNQKNEQTQAMGAATPFPSAMNQAIATKVEALSKIEQSAQVSQLFEKMVETLIHVKEEGIQETTFVLDGSAFSSSIFYGSEITVTEYSTAPKIFNISFSASPETLAFFESHAASLLNALRKGHFGFGVNRLDTSLLSENEEHTLPPVEPTEEQDNEEEDA